MKTRHFLSLAPLLIFLLSAKLSAGSILLADAQKNKQVNVVIRGVNKDAGKLSGGLHYGECIEFEVKNLTNSALEIKVETGRKLVCIYDSVQNMMVTRELIFALNPNALVKYKAYAMCIEQHDGSPTSKSIFKLGSMADAELIKLAETLDEHNYQSSGGQSAVWAVIGHKDTTEIWASTTEEKRFLRKYVSSLRGETTINTVEAPETVIYIKSPEFNISGYIEWEMKKKSSASLIVYDEQGNYVTSIFNNMKFDVGPQSYNFKVVSCLLEPDRKYLVRLKVNDLTEEELVVMSE